MPISLSHSFNHFFLTLSSLLPTHPLSHPLLLSHPPNHTFTFPSPTVSSILSLVPHFSTRTHSFSCLPYTHQQSPTLTLPLTHLPRSHSWLHSLNLTFPLYTHTSSPSHSSKHLPPSHSPSTTSPPYHFISFTYSSGHQPSPFSLQNILSLSHSTHYL